MLGSRRIKRKFNGCLNNLESDKRMDYKIKLIEGRFPCQQVGAETKRERGASSALPPLYFLHVWWARRPLTPCRAAVLGSILSANTNPEIFLRDLGIVKKQVIIGSSAWTLIGKNLELVKDDSENEYIPYSATFQKAFDKECERRTSVRETISILIKTYPEFSENTILRRWLQENTPLSTQELRKCTFPVVTVPADPAHINDRIAFANDSKVVRALGHPIRFDPEDSYGYGRAYETPIKPIISNVTVLDPTAGGGSIPFEALRLGCKVIANDLNPVATIIEKATIEYPAKYGKELLQQIEYYGNILVDQVRNTTTPYYYFAPLDETAQKKLKAMCFGDKSLFDKLNVPEYDQTGLLYCRTVTCPNCGNRAPLLNSFALQKKDDGWAVRPEIYLEGNDKKIRFIPYRLRNGRGPNGEDPEVGTVKRGTGTCIHCRQAISSDEIKRQAQGKSEYGTWSDELYCVVAVREQPKLDKDGKPMRYTSGSNKGKIRMEKVTFFRTPTQGDFNALAKVEKALKDNWAHWDEMGLIPTENIPEGNDMRPVIYGMRRWCDMFTPRQLFATLTSMETLHNMIPEIIKAEGNEKAKAIITYLQFMIDKFYDYNSKQTRWHYSRGALIGTFGRHDFSLKWTFGEMIAAGPHSGLMWGRDQVLDAYKGICDLLGQSRAGNITILNGSAANLSCKDKSVDIICVDPPYYNNVQYAELSDFYYVWEKRSLKDLYPDVFNRRLTNKNDEAVANPVRDGAVDASERKYESLMGEIFAECRRVLKDDGIMTMMFTHKTQEAWETLTRALIENGWIISATFPVDSESSASMHQKDQAAAASSIFLACRKHEMPKREPSIWSGFGGNGVAKQVREAVRQGLDEYSTLHLNAVDEMVASYGCALRVLSENWPVMDGEDFVTPVKAMREASTVVAQYQMMRLTEGRLGVNDVEAEASIALTLFGIYGTGWLPFDDALSLSKSLNIRLENKVAGYRNDGRMIGINAEISRRSSREDEQEGYYAPLISKGSKLRLALPEERNPKRLEFPQSEWDVFHGLIMAYREGDIPVARAYVQKHAEGKELKIVDILKVWADRCDDDNLQKEAERILYGLK